MTSRGQLTLRKEILGHMGVEPGEKLEVTLLPGGQVSLSRLHKENTIESLRGMLAGKTDVKLTLEEINEATAKAWAGLLK